MRNPRDWTNGKGALPSSSNNTVTCRKAELRRENQWNRAWTSLGSRLPYISLPAFLKGRHLRSIRSLEVRLPPNILHARADKLPSGYLGWECCCNCPAAPHLCPVRLRSRISLRAGLATHDCEGGAWTPCTPHRRRVSPSCRPSTRQGPPLDADSLYKSLRSDKASGGGKEDSPARRAARAHGPGH